MSELGSLTVAPEMEAEKHVAPETRLFRQIILMAVLDAIHAGSIGRANDALRAREEAFRWFLNAGDDFRLVCECAELHPDNVRSNALRYITLARQQRISKRRPNRNQMPARVAAP